MLVITEKTHLPWKWRYLQIIYHLFKITDKIDKVSPFYSYYV